jgi:hypothetical protein
MIKFKIQWHFGPIMVSFGLIRKLIIKILRFGVRLVIFITVY